MHRRQRPCYFSLPFLFPPADLSVAGDTIECSPTASSHTTRRTHRIRTFFFFSFNVKLFGNLILKRSHINNVFRVAKEREVILLQFACGSLKASKLVPNACHIWQH